MTYWEYPYNGFDTLRNENMQNIFQYVTQQPFNIFEDYNLDCNVEVYFLIFFFFLVTAWDESYPIIVDVILVGCVMVHMQRDFDKLLLLH